MSDQLPDDDEMKTRKTPDRRASDVGDDDMMTRPTPPSHAGATPTAGYAAQGCAAADSSFADETVIAGKYVVVRRIAEGGFGVVFEGYYTINGNRLPVAIKLLRASKHLDHATAIRFHEEVRTLCHLQHPNICRVIDGGLEPGTDRPFLVMDYAEGGTLKGRLKDAPQGLLDHDLVMQWLEEAALGLLAAEKNVDDKGNSVPVFHRDVKPENLLLQKERVVVADFGAARLGGDFEGVTSEVVPQLWTPAYGSPEQDGGFADHRSDIYALGTSFYHLLTGEITARRFDNAADRFQYPHDPCERRSSVPRELGAIVRRMTEPKPLARYQSFADVLADLRKLKAKPAPKWPRLVLAGIAAGALVVSGLEMAGVTDWIGTKVVQAREISEVGAECEELWRRVQALRERNWTELSELQQEVQTLAGVIERNRQLVSGLAASQPGSARVPLPDSYVDGTAVQLKTLEEHALALSEPRSSLAAARKALATTASKQIAEKLTGLEREIRNRPYTRELYEQVEQAKKQVANAQQARRQKVVDLEERLVRGELHGLRDAATQGAASLSAIGEAELQRDALAVAANVATAQGLLREMPSWDFGESAAAPIESLRAKLGALSRLASRAEVATGQMQRWIARESGELRRGWLQSAGQSVAVELSLLQESIAAFNGAASEPQPTDAIDTAKLEEQRKALAGRRTAALQRSRNLRTLAIDYSLLSELPVGATLPLDSLASLAGAAVADFSIYREAVRDTRFQLQVASQPVHIRPLAEAVLVAREKLATKLRAAPSNPSVEQSRELAGLRQGLLDAAELFEAGRIGLQGYEQARTKLKLGDVSCAHLLALCRPSPAAEACAPLEAARQVLVAEIHELESVRSKSVEDELALLRSGSSELVAVRERLLAAAEKLRTCGERGLLQQAEEAVQSVARANALMAGVATWQRWLATAPIVANGTVRSTGSLAAQCEHLETFCKALHGLRQPKPEAGDELLRQWWSRRQADLADAWCRNAAKDWVALYRAYKQRAMDSPADELSRAKLEREFAAFAKLHGALQKLALEDRELAGELRSEVVALTAPSLAEVIAWPDGWPDRAFMAPEGVQSLVLDADDAKCRKLYSQDFLAKAKSRSMRLWFFAERADGIPGGKRSPIYMAFCKNSDGSQAALVDVLPVTFAEIFQRRYIEGWSYWRKSYGRYPLATIAFNSQQSEASDFAAKVSRRVAGNEFALPAADFRDWPCCVPYGQPATTTAPSTARPQALLPTTDLSVQGLCYLQTGVCEWTQQEGLAVGSSPITKHKGNALRHLDTGFRLAIALSARAK